MVQCTNVREAESLLLSGAQVGGEGCVFSDKEIERERETLCVKYKKFPVHGQDAEKALWRRVLLFLLG